ncbi:hypothetical protein ADUPG1_005550, partial [Aduncisulcus paluster]
NTQCVVSSAGGSIQSDCIEKWYGTGCDKECPLQDSALCGTPTYGSCNTTSHECECIGGYEGSACQYFAYDSLENFICAELAEDSTDNVTIADSESVTCVEVDGQYELPVTDFQYIVCLDLSTSGLASLSGLEHASNLTTLNISGLTLTDTDSLVLEEISGLTSLTSLTVSTANITVTDELLTNIPKTVTELIMNNVSVPAGKSFSDFTVLTT